MLLHSTSETISLRVERQESTTSVTRTNIFSNVSCLAEQQGMYWRATDVPFSLQDGKSCMYFNNECRHDSDSTPKREGPG